jgi:hexosaminidase
MSLNIQLIPRPASVRFLSGAFPFQAKLTVNADPRLQSEAKLLAAEIARILPDRLIHTSSNSTADIRLEIDEAISHREGYRLEISSNEIRVFGSTAAGVFFGCQSLLQLIHSAKGSSASVELPALLIQDQPRFSWRGLMLDVSRHFFSVEQVCRILDLMSLHKLNVFHWHLTDDQGWRFPVRRYPRLTEIGSVRQSTLIGLDWDRPRRYDDQPYAGSYTREEIQHVVAYAAQRHITIVPEIEMPGHTQSAIAAYPELGNIPGIAMRCHWGPSQHILNPLPATVQFMQYVLEEVLELFPGQFIHVGGDEALKQEWAESRIAQDRMRELGLKNEEELQSWFIREMDRFLSDRGRRLIGWDEILEGGLAPGASVMSWRGIEGGVKAAAAGHDVVMAPNTHTYFDHYQAGPDGEPLAIGGMSTLEKVYSFEPIPTELDASLHHHILGGQGQLWTEYIGSMDYLEYMAFPRTCALAEALWTPAKDRQWDDFKSRLQSHRKLLNLHGVHLGPIPE